MNDSDLQLLENYAQRNSQDSFATLVNRHLNLVFSAALRQVHSPQLAEEISQSVFADLARSANKLKPDTILAAWLYEVTRRTAIDAVRRESRRQLREKVAHELTAMNATADDWTEIEPFLDEAMHALNETDRAAVLLRYFENKTLREVGETLGTTDDAAQKRVSRAVERLREFFSKRGVTIGASGLVVLISANAVQAAPIGLAVTIATAVTLAETSIAATTATLTKNIAMTTLQKTLVGAALIAVVGTGIYESQQNFRLKHKIQRFAQQQTSLVNQIQALQRERDKATERLIGLIAENEKLKFNPNEKELLKLRGEVARLKHLVVEDTEAQTESDPVEVAARKWLTKVNLLKQRLEQLPNAKIPELQFAEELDWLNAALGTPELKTEDDYRWDLNNLFGMVTDKFGKMGNKALEKYIQANNGQFPTDLFQLQPYFASPVDDAILQRYEIVPASSIPKAKEVGDRWLVAQKVRVFENYKNEGREVFGAKGYGNSWTFW
jgi:RNA polymerase sigma factor (sigma-70 family)